MADTEVMVGKYKVTVIRDACIGAASCIAFSPEVFQLDSESKAVVQEGSNDTLENLIQAAQSCPTAAIVVVDSESGEQLWPK